MSIIGVLQEISTPTLDALLEDPSLVEEFIAGDSPLDVEAERLDLDQYFSDLTYLLAGYNPDYISYEATTFPELKANHELMELSENKDFIPFTVIAKSKWDGLPLVNAFGAGIEIGDEMGYGKARYISAEQVKEMSEGLFTLGQEGFETRLNRASENEDLPFDLAKDIQEFLIEYFGEMLDYYQNAASRGSAMLLYLT
ncbi:protein of unknown function (DUF1877) [Synechococcus sp. PCC 7502]|uniref:DUF1877 family protein n=1 Tax=Synechococcus sp. PCC 7502 TaxID=1173263 RepID=UPI00029FDE84|nr:DUF1877 family protein [Synechococcus sp. PCC 7502]AFY75219.1 protein of unknown function (DUF1877) [Synechococcus sp. PCC 7502]